MAHRHFIDPLHVTSLIIFNNLAAILEYKYRLGSESAQGECAVVGCSNRSDREKGVGFYRLPAVVRHQGEQTHELSSQRRQLWLSRIHREDLGPEKYSYTRVCARHFISGMFCLVFHTSNYNKSFVNPVPYMTTTTLTGPHHFILGVPLNQQCS